MDDWLEAALDYLPQWLEFQVRYTEAPGCVVAVSVNGEIVLDEAFGVADLGTGEKLTPRHRFRVASHSKSFTAAGIMKLREEGRLRLDDPAGRFVDGLHPAVADVTIAQLLSHSSGVIRDGLDAGQWSDRRPFLDERELRTALAEPPVIPPNSRFKYSNHGFGLAGLVIEAIVGEPYRVWVSREIVGPAGLQETSPDMPIAGTAPMAHGHSNKLPAGKRFVIPGGNRTNALAPATGFVSTAADLARFFAQLDPAVAHSILSEASRREMTRPHWRDAYSSVERHYGLGIMRGRTGDCDWFGHGGAFQGFINRTLVVPSHRLAVSILTNTVERFAEAWADGALHIVSALARRGAPEKGLRDWSGRWWSLWQALDFVPAGDRVLVLNPALLNPLTDATELEISCADSGRIALATGLGQHGEPMRRQRSAGGEVEAIWLAGHRLLPEAAIAAELAQRYGSQGTSRTSSAIALPPNTALLIVDLQQAIDDPSWAAAGPRNNPNAEANVAVLLALWRQAGKPLFHIKHDGTAPNSTYRPGQPGNDFKTEARPLPGETVIAKRVNSAFIGTDLETRLRAAGITALVIAGVITNNSVEATVRMAGNLGFAAHLVEDACFTFARRDYAGQLRSAAEVHAMSLANMQGQYCTVVTTTEVIAAFG